ncbi:hypothetical protein [Nocardia otitidiscaviarum]|uniref:hypothetical protein n=1 Tax=Nocardia otitidiscaviarum TaxID=1823 RepID=UPI001894DC3A|nr:hypothetical protein [Nocardia otitidiscaviarum]MBF6177293.1 hypothetical protein [Nocardia otitidiscaviarum]
MAVFGLAMVRNTGRARVDEASIRLCDEATVVDPAPYIKSSRIGMILCLIPAGVIFTYGAWSGDLNIPLTGGQRIFFPFGAIFTVLWAFYEGSQLRKKKAMDLTLSPSSLSYPRPSSGMGSVDWGSIEEVSSGIEKGRRNKPYEVILKMAGSSKSEYRVINAHIPSIGAAATYWLIRFYHKHPELREELADHRAGDRIRAYRLIDQDDWIVRGS